MKKPLSPYHQFTFPSCKICIRVVDNKHVIHFLHSLFVPVPVSFCFPLACIIYLKRLLIKASIQCRSRLVMIYSVKCGIYMCGNSYRVQTLFTYHVQLPYYAFSNTCYLCKSCWKHFIFYFYLAVHPIHSVWNLCYKIHNSSLTFIFP